MSLGALMGRGTSFALGLICLARAALAHYGEGALPEAAARLILRRFILPAEAAVRRAILVVAASMKVSVPRSTGKREGPAKAPPPAAPGRARRPVFRLSEPAGRKTRPLVKPEDYPRITLLDEAALRQRSRPPVSQKRPKTDGKGIAARLFYRLAALEAAYGDPEREARRFLRARARAQKAANGAPLRLPLAFIRIPGHGRHLHQTFREVLEDLNRAAFKTLLPKPDSS